MHSSNQFRPSKGETPLGVISNKASRAAKKKEGKRKLRNGSKKKH
jgi:hypothetical protein